MSTVEERLDNLEKNLSKLSSMVGNLAMSLSETTQKNAEIGMHLAALIRTIQDGKDLNASNLSESSILNLVDKLDSYVKTALDKGFIKQAEKVSDSSILCLKQTDAQGNEVNRKLLMNIHEQSDAVKSMFVGKKVSDIVSGQLEVGTDTSNFIVLDIFEPTESLTKEIQ